MTILKLRSVRYSLYSFAVLSLICGSLIILENKNVNASDIKLSAEKILKAANKAERQGKFVGILQVEKFDKGLRNSSSIKVYQKNSKIKMEYLSPESRGMVMIDDGVNLCKLDLQSKRACISFIPSPKNQVERILKNYQIAQEKSEEILNRECYVLNLKPKHKFGINKKIWVDKINWSTLRAEEYDSTGNLVVTSFYTQIDFKSDIDDRIFSMPEDCQKFITQDQIGNRSDKETIKLLGFQPIQPKYLPSGYELNGRYYEMCLVGKPVVHLRYSDGLSSFSIFEHSEKGHQVKSRKISAQDLPPVECLLPKDYLNRAQLHYKGGLIFVMMGNLPEEEAKKIWESIK